MEELLRKEAETLALCEKRIAVRKLGRFQLLVVGMIRQVTTLVLVATAPRDVRKVEMSSQDYEVSKIIYAALGYAAFVWTIVHLTGLGPAVAPDPSGLSSRLNAQLHRKI